MIIMLSKSLGRAMIVLLLCLSVFSAAYFIDYSREADVPASNLDTRTKDDLLIDRIIANSKKQERELELAEQKRQQEKIRASEAVLLDRPKSSNISFFLDSPFRASLSIPQLWEGKYRAEESVRKFDLVYASSSGQVAKLISIYLFNNDEWLKNQRQVDYRVLEKLPNLVFAYQTFSGAGLSENEAAEFQKMSDLLSNVIKSFKSQRQ